MKVDPRLEAAYARGRMIQAKLRAAEGGSISASRAAARLGISQTMLLRWYRTGKVIGWKEGKIAIRFPVWQFKGRKVLRGLAEVVATMDSGSKILDGYGHMLFLLSDLGALQGGRPLDLLRKGDVQGAKEIAVAYFGR